MMTRKPIYVSRRLNDDERQVHVTVRKINYMWNSFDLALFIWRICDNVGDRKLSRGM